MYSKNTTEQYVKGSRRDTFWDKHRFLLNTRAPQSAIDAEIAAVRASGLPENKIWDTIRSNERFVSQRPLNGYTPSATRKRKLPPAPPPSPWKDEARRPMLDSNGGFRPHILFNPYTDGKPESASRNRFYPDSTSKNISRKWFAPSDPARLTREEADELGKTYYIGTLPGGYQYLVLDADEGLPYALTAVRQIFQRQPDAIRYSLDPNNKDKGHIWLYHGPGIDKRLSQMANSTHSGHPWEIRSNGKLVSKGDFRHDDCPVFDHWRKRSETPPWREPRISAPVTKFQIETFWRRFGLKTRRKRKKGYDHEFS